MTFQLPPGILICLSLTTLNIHPSLHLFALLMLKYQELSLEMTKPDSNLSYSLRAIPVVSSAKHHQEIFLLDSKLGLISNSLVDDQDCMVDFTSLMPLKRVIDLETKSERLLLNLSKAISIQIQLQPASLFQLKFFPLKDSTQEVHKVHLAVPEVKDKADKVPKDLVEHKGNVAKQVKDSEDHKDNVANQDSVEYKDNKDLEVINKVLVKHNQIKTLHHFLLAVIS